MTPTLGTNFVSPLVKDMGYDIYHLQPGRQGFCVTPAFHKTGFHWKSHSIRAEWSALYSHLEM